MPEARRYYVSGRVQGVFFRASTRQQAQQLGLRGYARNLDDGRVEVVASGEPEALDQLYAWLFEGSPAAHVSNVEPASVDHDEASRLAGAAGFGTG